MLKDKTIICVSPAPWDFIWTRKQRFMLMLSENNKIIYVESIRGIIQSIRKGKGLNLLPKIKKINSNLFIFTPPSGLPLGRSISIKKINNYLLYYYLKKSLTELYVDSKTCIFWSYDPTSAILMNKIRPRFSIYECVDEHSAYEYPGANNVGKLEKDLLKLVDIVFVTARGLLENKKKFNTNTFFAPNGVDFNHFSAASKIELQCPEDIALLKRPIIGFIGYIANWIDLELIIRIARSRPDWSIVMIGPSDHDVHSLIKEQNIYFLGRREKEHLPNYLKYFDVCLNPFKDCRLNKTVNPLKVYEYLAAGKPVVSSRMPELEHLKDIIHFISVRDNPEDVIQTALDENSQDLINKRVEAMRKYSWATILDNMLKIIEKHIIN